MNIAIIPARKGSKRIKNKNIKTFFGKPVIYYSIIAAKKCKIFDKIIVSTDCKKIAKISKQYGAEVLFPRPKNLSNDKVDTVSVIHYEIKKLLKKEKKINFVCCVYPCSPLINHKVILKSFKKIKNKKFDYVFLRYFFVYSCDDSTVLDDAIDVQVCWKHQLDQVPAVVDLRYLLKVNVHHAIEKQPFA